MPEEYRNTGAVTGRNAMPDGYVAIFVSASLSAFLPAFLPAYVPCAVSEHADDVAVFRFIPAQQPVP
jgi:hypothetical protein